MYDINTKNVKKGKNVYFILIGFGLLFVILFGGILISNFIKSKEFDSEILAEEVKLNSSINSEGETIYSPIYYYVIDGKKYSCSAEIPSSVNPGMKSKKIYYDSKNPSFCMTEYSKSSNTLIIISLLLPLSIIGYSIYNIIKINKRVKLINELNQKGKLVKNLPYHLEDTGAVVNKAPIQCPVVEYTLSSGSKLTLHGDPRYDGKKADADGLVDLVIDENNPDNYFIDFEINRITGNLPSDYYKDTSNNNM